MLQSKNKQVTEDEDQYGKLRKEFQAVADAEIERIKQKLQDLTYEQAEFNASVRSAWRRREEEESQETNQLYENLIGVQEQLFVAKTKLKQRAYVDYFAGFCQSIDKKVNMFP